MAGVLEVVAFCLLLTISATVVTAQPTCQTIDDQSLQYFKSEIVYARQEFQTWVTGTNCCTWNGVTCDSSGHVTELNIQNIDLNPPNPAGPGGYYIGTGLTTLPNIVTITLKNIALNGPVPPAWGKLDTLQVLSLDACNVNGDLPAAFCNLKGLKNFTFADNLLTAPLPTCLHKDNVATTFPSLTFFNISGNPGSGSDGWQ